MSVRIAGANAVGDSEDPRSSSGGHREGKPHRQHDHEHGRQRHKSPSPIESLDRVVPAPAAPLLVDDSPNNFDGQTQRAIGGVGGVGNGDFDLLLPPSTSSESTARPAEGSIIRGGLSAPPDFSFDLQLDSGRGSPTNSAGASTLETAASIGTATTASSEPGSIDFDRQSILDAIFLDGETNDADQYLYDAEVATSNATRNDQLSAERSPGDGFASWLTPMWEETLAEFSSQIVFSSWEVVAGGDSLPNQWGDELTEQECLSQLTRGCGVDWDDGVGSFDLSNAFDEASFASVHEPEPVHGAGDAIDEGGMIELAVMPAASMHPTIDPLRPTGPSHDSCRAGLGAKLSLFQAFEVAAAFEGDPDWLVLGTLDDGAVISEIALSEQADQASNEAPAALDSTGRLEEARTGDDEPSWFWRAASLVVSLSGFVYWRRSMAEKKSNECDER